MEAHILIKISEDNKLHDYLINHSNWYRLLNRDSDYFKSFLDEYKKNKRNNNIKKIDDIVDNIDLITNVMKFVE